MPWYSHVRAAMSGQWSAADRHACQAAWPLLAPNNLFAARKSRRSLLQHFAMLLRIGGGAFENGVNAIYGNVVASVDLSQLELNEEHARQVADALRDNT